MGYDPVSFPLVRPEASILAMSFSLDLLDGLADPADDTESREEA